MISNLLINDSRCILYSCRYEHSIAEYSTSRTNFLFHPIKLGKQIKQWYLRDTVTINIILTRVGGWKGQGRGECSSLEREVQMGGQGSDKEKVKWLPSLGIHQLPIAMRCLPDSGEWMTHAHIPGGTRFGGVPPTEGAISWYVFSWNLGTLGV